MGIYWRMKVALDDGQYCHTAVIEWGRKLPQGKVFTKDLVYPGHTAT